MPSKKEEAKPSAAENLKDVKHKIIVMSGKGGVGKSTVAVNLATALTMSGKKVGLLDADMHGPSIPMMFGLQDSQMIVNDKGKIQPIQTASNVKIISIALLLENSDSPVIWRGPVKMGAIKQFLEEVEWGALDYLIVDLPPGTGDEPLSVAQLVPSPDGVVIVTTPQDVALLSVRKSINFVKAVGLRTIGLVENMDGLVCPHCNKRIEVFGKGGAEKAAKDFGIPLLGSIPLTPSIADSGDDGVPFAGLDNGVATRFREMADRIVELTENGAGK
ncbi:MAG TPA: Mrp/NBP35 family ATP-binding protein [Thermoplasmata archaeon]|nr:Mrp/NBP35 family ATP-binding protein [Thermoplasmata archaeon]